MYTFAINSAELQAITENWIKIDPACKSTFGIDFEGNYWYLKFTGSNQELIAWQKKVEEIVKAYKI